MIRIRDISKDHTQVNYVGEYREEFLVDAGDYLVGMDGNFTVAKWRGPRALLNQRVSRLQWYSGHLEPSFLAVALQHRLSELQGKKAYTTVDHLSSGQIENAVVPLPPLAEQKRIVAKVDELMELCDRLEAQQQEQETQHATLARASLARFAGAPTPANLDLLFHKSYSISPADLRKSILTLAVQGKLVSQVPTDEPVEYSLPKLAAVGVRSQDDLVPARWFLVPLGKTGEWRGGGTPSTSRSDYWDGDMPWVSPKDMKTDRIADAKDHISEAAIEGSSVRLIPEGSILMVVRGMILARAFPVALTMREVTINQDMKALLPIEGESAEFLLLVLRAIEPDVLLVIERSSHGTCKLKTNVLEALLIPIPPLAEQRRIVAKVDQLMALVDALESQLATAQVTGATLMKAAVSELTAAA
jgi:type I restriction enzyme S subunit